MGENAREAYAANGWKMTMICPTPCRGVSEEQRKEYINGGVEYELDGALKVIRFPLMREKRNPFLRIIRFWRCQVKQYKIAKKLLDTDVLFLSSTPPVRAWLIKKIKKKLGCKVIYNLQDIFPDSLVNSGMVREGSVIWKIGRRLEDKTYSSADRIIVISERFKSNIMKKGVPEEKISLIPNWVDQTAVEPIAKKDNPLFDRLQLSREKFTVTYCGNLGITQNLMLLADAAECLKHISDIQFVVFGDGVCRDELAEAVKQKGLENFKIFPFQAYADIANVFSLGDISLVVSKAGTGKSSVPSKAWSIMSAGRAVLASFDRESELFDVIENAGCGLCVEPDSSEALCEAVLRLYADRQICDLYGKRGREYILSNLTKEIGCGKLVDLISG